ncbi:MAG: tetratricopeptide repeat protein [Planctomycetota bacterium]|nr:tetratricopeptide repeat protein [Planctomycetota bacterium]
MSPAEDPDEALERQFQDAIARGEASDALRLVDERLREGRFAESRAWLETAFAALPSEVRVATRLLETLQRYHQWRQFDDVAATALDRHAASGELWFVVGCGAEARGDWQSAAEAFGKASALAPDEVEPVLRLARAHRMSQRVEDAIRALTAALRRHPEVAPLHAALGYALIQNEQPERAVKCFRAALERQPDWHPYLNDLAGALMLCERWREAAVTALASLERRKRNERAWTVFAIANARLGDDKRAEQGYRNAIRAARDAGRAKGNYGLFLSKRPDRLLEAVRLLREAEDAHPNWTEVCDRLERITRTGPG